MDNKISKALIIDDNPDDILLLSKLLKRCYEGIQIFSSLSGQDAMNKLKDESFDITFLDLRMPDISGLDLLKHVREGGLRTPVVIITGQGDEKAAVKAMKAGACDYLIKDELDPDLIDKTIYHVLEKKKLEDEKDRLERELRQYTDNLEDLVEERTSEIEYLINYKELILSTLHEYVRVIDPKEKVIQYESRNIKRVFGDKIGKPCYSIWSRDEPCEDCVSLRAIEGGVVIEKEEEEGGRSYRITATPLRNRDGSMSAIEVITDVTDKKKMEEELERNRRFSIMGEISAHLAHEIRNPLHKIKMAAGFLAELNELEPNERKIISVISNSATELERLANSILDFTRPQKPNWEKTPINILLEEVYEDFISSMHNYEGVRLGKDIPEQHIEGWIDSVKLKSVIKNLLVNAIQAIEGSGEVKLSAYLKDENTVEIKVIDTGRGMPKKVIQNIFNPFFTTKTKGTGLGMSIVAKFVEIHRGSINVLSEVGRGTEVIVSIPLMSVHPEACSIQ